ncbi:MAG: porin, partial [Succinivibrio sp.]|nr:porin [Succinivibrio sp.]
MKKSVLALAVAGAMVASSVASAAVVYDKDGTSMAIGGRVEAMWHSGHDSADGTFKSTGDHTIRDRVRLNVSGRTKLADGITGYGFWETQNQHNGDSTQSQNTALRDAYVGVDFGKY